MKRTSFADWPCSIARTVDLVGDSWTPLVLREAFHGVRRFDDFQRELGIARNTLADRLRMLVDEGLLAKQCYEKEPPRYDYVLTEKGADFFGVLAAMSHWGDRWLADDESAPITFHHETCGRDTHAEVVCVECGELMSARNTSMLMGTRLS
jgi:DNA-binding HxlR family transcriptional regulator